MSDDTPHAARGTTADVPVKSANGYLALAVGLILFVGSGLAAAGGVVPGALGILVAIFLLKGLAILQPNESLVCLLFGKYAGTELRPGLWWVNPFYSRRKVSRRLETLECGPLKVNDAVGNPVDIGAVVVWHIEDAAKATLEVLDYKTYVKAQSETALRRLASAHPYDHVELEELPEGTDAAMADSARLTLRDGSDEISQNLLTELRKRMQPVGVVVDEARISHLAYSAEIAGAMLRKQAAGAVVAARRLVVRGAVSIVENALTELDQKKLGVGLDADRRAALVSNLLVVLVSDREAAPVINTGSP